MGAHIIGGIIFEPPNGSWLSTSSGTRGLFPVLAASSIDSATSDSIALAHGFSGFLCLPVCTSVLDVLFVVPGTSTPASVNSFSIAFGFDADGGEFPQAVIIEAFDSSDNLVASHVEPNLYFDGSVSLSAPSAARLRLTEVGGVGFDDLSFTIVPEPSTALLLASGLGAFSLRRRRG